MEIQNQDIRNIEVYNLRTFDHKSLKQEVVAKFGQINEIKSMQNFLSHMFIHLLGWALIIGLKNPFISTASTLMMGFNLVGIFIIFHDAGHRTRSKNIQLNDFEGDIAGGLFGFGTSWILARESHRVHHKDTGKINESSALWLPMTIEEYSQRSQLGKRLYRLKMTNILFPILEFEGFFKVLKNVFPDSIKNPKIRREIIRSTFFALGINVLQIALSLRIMGIQGLFFLYVLPNVLGISIGAFLDRMNHANPEMLFYGDEDWDTNESNMQGSIRLKYHPIINFLINNMNDHAIHHYVPSVPGHNLKEARLYVEEKYPLFLNEQTFSWKYIYKIYSQCHLLESNKTPRFISFNQAEGLMVVQSSSL